jgi:Tfp pilus assembly protein PilO
VNRRSPLIAGGALALVAILAVVLLVLPKMGQVGEAQDQLTEAQDQEATLQAQLGALQDAQAQAPETERQIAEIEEQVPPTADLPELFRLLQNAADTSAVDFFAFAPGSPVPDPAGQFSVIPAQVTVTGSYFAIDQYLFQMETLPRAAKVMGITLTPTATSAAPGTVTPEGSLQMLMSIEFYTTDSSAGPGSVPGPTAPSGTGTVAGPTGATGSSTTTSDGGAA